MRCTDHKTTSTPPAPPPKAAYRKRHATPRLTRVAENVHVQGHCKLNPVYNITGGSSVSPNPRNKLNNMIVSSRGKKSSPTLLFYLRF